MPYPTSPPTFPAETAGSALNTFPDRYNVLRTEVAAVIQDLINARGDSASIAQLLAGVPTVLKWSSTADDYLPAHSKGTSRPKIFIGAIDPQTVPGVQLNDGDCWRQRP